MAERSEALIPKSSYESGLSQAGGLGVLEPQSLAKQLTLSQPGGQIMPTTVLQAPPPDFQTLRRPCELNKKTQCDYWAKSIIRLEKFTKGLSG